MAPFGIGRARKARTVGQSVCGQALVVRGDSGYSALNWWTSTIVLRVTAPGLGPALVVHADRFHRDRVPVAGFVLPVDIDPDDRSSVRVRWDEAPTVQQRIAGGDPAILDPAATRRQVAAARGETPGDSPWGSGRIQGWPPDPPLADGRVPATALVVSRSADPGAHRTDADDYDLPCGPHSGLVADGLHSYIGWALLCVVMPDGARRGVYVRRTLRRGHLAPLLPVAIDPARPDDVEIAWGHAPHTRRAHAGRPRSRAAAAGR
jgi:hypothetical protein